jgi:hypothetical protein
MNFIWIGERWMSINTYFAILQRALCAELSEYGGEVWG